MATINGATINDICRIMEIVHGRSVANFIEATPEPTNEVVIGVLDPVDSSSVWLRDAPDLSCLHTAKLMYRDFGTGTPKIAIIDSAERFGEDGFIRLTLDREVRIAQADDCCIVWPCVS